MKPRVAAAAAAVSLILLVVAFTGGRGGSVSAPQYDRCSEAATENEVREMWAAVSLKHPGDEGVRITADLMRQAAELCREFRDRKPMPLPATLKELVR